MEASKTIQQRTKNSAAIRGNLRLTAWLKGLTIALICVSFISFFSFNYFFLFGNITRFGDAVFTLLRWLMLAGLIVIPSAVFLKTNKFNTAIKWLLVLVPLISLAWISRYLNLENIPANQTQEIFSSLNNFMPIALVGILFVTEALLMASIAVLFWVRDWKIQPNPSIQSPRPQPSPPQSQTLATLFKQEFTKSKTKQLLFFLPVFLIAMPLNLFDNFVRLFSPNVFAFFEFRNFSVWHVLVFLGVFVCTYFAYRFLKTKSSDTRHKYLCVLALSLLVQYMNRASVLIGDGYNIYYTILAFIPLFICTIGAPVAAAAVFSKNRTLNNLAFFVHAGGALSVFFYFGRDGLSNFGTIFSYSFLYFIVMHGLLFAVCCLPTLLGEHKFTLKDTVVPMVYYACVIVVAAVVSEVITLVTLDLFYDSFGAAGVIFPNFAFTQISPIAHNVPPVYINIFGLTFDILYLPILFSVYVAIFWAFYGLYLLLTQKLAKDFFKVNELEFCCKND